MHCPNSVHRCPKSSIGSRGSSTRLGRSGRSGRPFGEIESIATAAVTESGIHRAELPFRRRPKPGAASAGPRDPGPAGAGAGIVLLARGSLAGPAVRVACTSNEANAPTGLGNAALFQSSIEMSTSFAGDDMPTTHYHVLGVPRNATSTQIHASYVSLARRFHPDLNSDPDANQRMAELNLAYETLSDHDKRSRYDAEIALRDPADELNHSQAVALAASAARLVADYCPDALVAAALDAAELYALRPLPSSAFLASQAAAALTSSIFAETALTGPAGILAADSAAKAARAAAATPTAALRRRQCRTR